MAELLIELFSEEIPARMQVRAAEDFKKLVTDRLDGAGLSYTSAAAHVTPRRLVLVVDGLPDKQPDIREERRGPRVGAPDKAVQGFLGAAGVTLEQCEKRDTGKGEFWFAIVEKTGSATADVLPGLVEEAIRAVSWPKSMRWARNSFRWVRPLHHVLAILDGVPLDGALDLGDWVLTFCAETKGHRFLAPASISVSSFADYAAKLRDAHVIVDRDARKAMIASGAQALAAAEGLTLRDDPGLLEEVVGLVEWPQPVMGSIDAAFMDVPAEALVTSMRSHQKYFALSTADGALAPRFITVSNMRPDPVRDTNIVEGNEKVLRARLSDAKFFWDQDRAETLESRLLALDAITFYDRLGTVGDKARRISALAAWLAGRIDGADASLARRAAGLAKADLVTGMVGEFPELQGIMGRYYAQHDGEAAEVADAIASHYAPAGPSDACPTAPVAVAVALADKLDTLVGFFGIGQTPTGSRDPFALRRAALGVIRLVGETGLRLSLKDAFGAAYDLHCNPEEGGRTAGESQIATRDETINGLLSFFADRLQVHLRGEGVRHDLIAAVFGVDGGEDDLVRLRLRVDALSGLLGEADGANLLAGYRRAANIVRIEEKKDGHRHDGSVDTTLFNQNEESDLADALAKADDGLGSALASDGFGDAMQALAELRGPIDAFFEQVTVNADDAATRENRLKLLGQIAATMNRVADFSRIEG